MCQLIILYLRPDSRYILSNGRNTYGELMGKGVVPSSISHCHPAGSGGKRVLALPLRANGWLGPGLPTKRKGNAPITSKMKAKIRWERSKNNIRNTAETSSSPSKIYFVFWHHSGWISASCHLLFCLWLSGSQVWWFLTCSYTLQVSIPNDARSPIVPLAPGWDYYTDVSIILQQAS